MNNLMWTKVEEIVDQALNLPKEERKTFINNKCEGDKTLKTEVTTLLDSITESQGWLENPQTYKEEFLEEITDEVDKLNASRSLIDKEIGSYLIKEKLGEGGMGSVYLAERADGKFDHKVAIKIIRNEKASEENIRRFEQERTILAGLNHSGIAKLFDGGITADGFPYFVMEYVDGIPIDQFCRQHDSTVPKLIDLFKQVLEAVRHAHENLIVHRDLKPGNILVTASGKVKILDFGISKVLQDDQADNLQLTQTNARLLTPKYAAPEQILQKRITTATDIYALGIVLYNLLSNSFPFDLDDLSQYEMEQIILESDPPKPSAKTSTPLKKQLKGDLDAIVLKAIRKESQQRYRTANEFWDDLDNFQQGLPIRARDNSLKYRTEKFFKRNKQELAIAFGVFLLIIGFAGFYTWRITEERNQAQFEAQKAKEVKEFMLGIFQANDPTSERYAGKNLTPIELLKIGAESVEQDLDTQPRIYTEMMLSLAHVFTSLGEFDLSTKYYRKALDKSINSLGRTQITGDTFARMTNIFFHNGQYDSAEFYINKALAIDSLYNKKATIRRAKYLSILARSVSYQGRFHESIPLFKKADSLFLALDAPKHKRRLAIRAVFGSLLIYLDQLDKAEQVLLRNLSLKKQIYDSTHTEIANTKIELAAVYNDKQEYQKAEKYILSALNDLKILIEPEDPQMGKVYGELSSIYLGLKKYNLALEAAKKSTAIYKKIYGEQHHAYLNQLNKYALSLSSLNFNHKALEIYREIVVLKRKIDGDSHPYMANAYYNLAVHEDSMKMLKNARLHYLRAIQITEEHFGTSSKKVAPKYESLAVLLGKTGKKLKADSLFKNAENIFKEKFTSNHPKLANHYHNRGSFELKRNNYKKAKSLLRNALKIYTKIDIDDEDMHKRIQHTENLLTTINNRTK